MSVVALRHFHVLLTSASCFLKPSIEVYIAGVVNRNAGNDMQVMLIGLRNDTMNARISF